MRSSPLRRWLLAAALFTMPAAAAALAQACGGDSNPSPPPGGSDATTGGPTVDVVSPNNDGGALSTAMRLAHLAPGLGRVDFCYKKPEQAKPTGPLLAAGAPARDAGAEDADASADDDAAADAEARDAAASTSGPLSPFSVTSYVQLEGTGTFDLFIVRGDATSCAAPLATGRITLDPGRLTTVTLVDGPLAATDAGASGDAEADADAPDADAPDAGLASVRFFSFADDPRIDAARARVRVLHMALGEGPEPALGALRVTALSGQNPVVAPAVDPGKATRAGAGEPPVDALGYATLPPIAPLTALEVTELGDAAARGFTTEFADLGLGGASLHTMFVARDGGAFMVLSCNDKSTVGRRMECRRLGRAR